MEVNGEDFDSGLDTWKTILNGIKSGHHSAPSSLCQHLEGLSMAATTRDDGEIAELGP